MSKKKYQRSAEGEKRRLIALRSIEVRDKIKNAKKGIVPSNFNEIQKLAWEKNKGKPSWNSGKKGFKSGKDHWTYGKTKPRPDVSGENNHKWKGGISWGYLKKKICIRDDYTCQICGHREIEIMEVDHIKPKSKFPELKYDMSNLIVLCPNCHRRKTNRELRNTIES